MEDGYEMEVKKEVEGVGGGWSDNGIVGEVKLCKVGREEERECVKVMKKMGKNDGVGMGEKMLKWVLLGMLKVWDGMEGMGGGMRMKELGKMKVDGRGEGVEKLEGEGGKVLRNGLKRGGVKEWVGLGEMVVKEKEEGLGGMMVNVMCKEG